MTARIDSATSPKDPQQEGHAMSGRSASLARWLMAVLVMMSGSLMAADWDQLTTEEQTILSPYQSQWEDLDEAQRERLQKGVNRWLGMSDGERRLVLNRFSRWQDMSPTQRRTARNRYQKFRSLPARQQQQLRSVYKRFQNLPASQRKQLRERFNRMSPQQKRAFMQGARMNQNARTAGIRQHMQGKLGQLDTSDQEMARELFQRMTPVERQALMKLVSSSETDQLSELIHNLNGMSDTDRQAWLLSPAELERLESEQ